MCANPSCLSFYSVYSGDLYRYYLLFVYICISTHTSFVQVQIDELLSWILAGKQTVAIKQTGWVRLPAWLIHIKGTGGAGRI